METISYVLVYINQKGFSLKLKGST